MPKQTLRETARILEATTSTAPGHLVVQLISPGWGSSGYYSPAVLAEAASNQVIASGTHMYADHPTDTEAMERPERSIRDLMSVTTEAARIATDADIQAGADQGALVAEVRVLSQYRDLVADLHEAIGVSVLGSASDITEGEAEGRRGRIIEGLAYVQSVDWVTRAGRGGRVLQLLESARTREATVNDRREALQAVLRDAYGTDDDYVWVRDFDDSTVWFEIDSGDDGGLYGQTYTHSDDGTVALSGDRNEVRIVTTYVPATRPDGNTTQESEEDTMPKIQIEEADHTRLIETAGRVDALVSENATLKAENQSMKEAAADRARNDRARELITERAKAGGVTFDDLQTRGLLVDLPLTEAGVLDETRFSATVDTAAARVKEAQTSAGSGEVRGFGGPVNDDKTNVAERRTTNPWGRSLTEQKGA